MNMVIPRPQDALHKIQLYRLLTEILDTHTLAQQVYFKGGTCASMLGFLDRFSVDLDFDLADKADKKNIHNNLIKIFNYLELSLKQKSKKELLYVVCYEAKHKTRNSIKLSFLNKAAQANAYKPLYLAEIDRYAVCQTIETMFANKLVSLTDRYVKYQMIAGRDLYDIHHFFLHGYKFSQKVIEERTGEGVVTYFKELKKFIVDKINDRVISEDLNYLLPFEKFVKIKKVLKRETLLLLDDEIKRLQTISGCFGSFKNAPRNA